MTCKLCGGNGVLANRSHVIPRWMYGLLPNDGHNFKIISPVAEEYEKRSPSGLYDSFVCQECEHRFEQWDDYAAKLLRPTSKHSFVGVDLGAYDYGKLARFYLSVLWRMHACSCPVVSIDLGADASQLGRALLTNDDSALDRFQIVPSWSKHLLALGIFEPKQFDIDGVLYWKIYMPRFQALINISGNPSSARFEGWIMQKGKPLLMLEDTFESGEVQIATRASQTNRERRNANRH